MKRLFKKTTIGGWAAIGLSGFWIYIYFDTEIKIFLYISLIILAIGILWIFAGFKEKK